MKRLFSILLAASLLCPASSLLVGCKQLGITKPTSSKAVAFNSLASIQAAVNRAMTVYGQAVRAGRVSEANKIKVRAMHAKYRASFKIAVLAAKQDQQQLAPADLENLANALVQLISTL